MFLSMRGIVNSQAVKPKAVSSLIRKPANGHDSTTRPCNPHLRNVFPQDPYLY
jgi:hypothetical protein